MALISRSGPSGIGVNSHIDFSYLRATYDAIRVAIGNQFAAVQDREPIDGGEQSVHEMSDPDDRTTARAHVLDEGNQRCACMLGEAAGDLIEQQHPWTRCERAGQFQTLSIEQGQSACMSVRLFH